MVLKSAAIPQSKITALRQQRDKVHSPSRFKHLMSHKGLRPRCLHGLIAPTGAGKSTYIRSLVHDLACELGEGEEILVWLSEETSEQFLTSYVPHSPLSHEKLNRIKIISELEFEEHHKMLPKVVLEEYLSWGSIKYLIFDNITTSNQFYQDKTLAKQGDFVAWIKYITGKYGIATVLVAHTGADTSRYATKIINENDVRGSKTIVNYLEFLYILQQFTINNQTVQTIRVEKHRGYNVDERFYILNYCPDTLTYLEDRSIDFQEFKELFEKMHSRKN